MKYVENVVKGMICPIRIVVWTSVGSMNFAEIVETELINKTGISKNLRVDTQRKEMDVWQDRRNQKVRSIYGRI